MVVKFEFFLTHRSNERKTRSRQIDLASLSAGVNGQTEGTKGKIVTSLSVSQIAYVIRILVDMGIISTQNKTDILSRAAQSIVTRNASEISIKSLKAKFYTVDAATKEAVRKLLLELLKHMTQ